MTDQQSIVFEWNGEQPLTEDIPRPVSAGKMVPDWYQKLPTEVDGAVTVKLCASFGDGLREGWIIPLPFDMSIMRGNENISCVIPDSNEEPTIYGASDAEFRTNSSFRAPELKIPNPWKIHTPDGYSTLVTYPRNREDNGIKPYSLLVETDTYDGPINIPVSTTEPKSTIPAGVPFIHVIPLKRDMLLSDCDVTNESESPEIWEMWDATHKRTFMENGYYRRYCWVSKDITSVKDMTDGSNDEEIDSTPSVSQLVTNEHDRSEEPEPEHEPKLIISDDYSNIVPEPTMNTHTVPDWINDPDVLGINTDDEEHFRSWAKNAMDLGWNIPVVVDINIHVENGEVTLDSSFSGSYQRSRIGDVGPADKHSSKQLGEKYSSGRPAVGKITSPWFTCTPPGYSVLHSEPLNHRQQYISSYTGLVDSDRYIVDGNLLGKVDLPDGDYLVEPGEPAVTQIGIHRDSMLKNGYVIAGDY